MSINMQILAPILLVPEFPADFGTWLQEFAPIRPLEHF